MIERQPSRVALAIRGNHHARSVFTHVRRSQSHLCDRHRPFPKKVSVTGGEAPRNGPHPMADFAAIFSRSRPLHRQIATPLTFEIVAACRRSIELLLDVGGIAIWQQMNKISSWRGTGKAAAHYVAILQPLDMANGASCSPICRTAKPMDSPCMTPPSRPRRHWRNAQRTRVPVFRGLVIFARSRTTPSGCPRTAWC